MEMFLSLSIMHGKIQVLKTSSSYSKVLQFWFGEGENLTQNSKLWWIKDPQLDSQIKSEYEPLIESAVQGKLSQWLQEPQGTLAWIILLDQFCRNAYRDTPLAFQNDPLALQTCLKAIEQSFHDELHPVMRSFLFMPLMHSEDLKIQDLSLKYFGLLAEEANRYPQYSEYLKSSLIFAKKHYEIIQRFDRYPHRNKILGRSSTEEEIAFLTQPGSSF